MNEFYRFLWFFCVYSFFGWCIEVIYAAVDDGRFVNRGFLNGPVCPIYGFGVCIVVLCLTPVADNIILLFIGAALLTSVLEYITGFVLEKIYHERWWDYSNQPFNIGGYVCLKFSLMWGIACLVVIRLIHPFIIWFVDIIPSLLGQIMLAVFLTVFAADFIFTIVNIKRVRRAMLLAEKFSAELHSLSDGMGNYIYEGVKTVREHGGEIKERLDEIKENIGDLKDTITNRANDINKEIQIAQLKDAISQKLKIGAKTYGRLAKAFPNLRLKEKIKQYENEAKK